MPRIGEMTLMTKNFWKGTRGALIEARHFTHTYHNTEHVELNFTAAKAFGEYRFVTVIFLKKNVRLSQAGRQLKAGPRVLSVSNHRSDCGGGGADDDCATLLRFATAAEPRNDSGKEEESIERS